MKNRLWFAAAGVLASLVATAGEPVALRGITATARPARTIGVEMTRIDSTTLRTSPAQSMADVLTFGSAGYIKSYGRASVATLTFRGTSPSHTAVMWNGMRISSPMLGSTDFSTIPSYLIDSATLLHGSSSLTDTDGGIGGLVNLSTAAGENSGDKPFGFQAVQGYGSWNTVDDYALVRWQRERATVSARVSYARSDNDFKFVNYDKKENIYGPDHQIIESYYPTERNRNAAFHDLHAMVSAEIDDGSTGRWNADVWWMNSYRELPLMTTDYSATEANFENAQRERTLRAVARWNKNISGVTINASAGMIFSDLHYDSSREMGAGITSVLTRSITRQRTAYASAGAIWLPRQNIVLQADVDFYHHNTSSTDYAPAAGPKEYGGHRPETRVMLSGRWRPTPRAGLGLIVREQIYGHTVAAPVPAVFAEYRLLAAADMWIKASGSRNYRVPTLNDLYTLPGGNPDLKAEQGWTGDISLSASTAATAPVNVSGSAGVFGSRITDWIQWLPSPRGFYVPRNVHHVNATGVEASMTASATAGAWKLSLTASYTYSRSINRGEAIGAGDMSAGKQLPYVPRHAASGIFRVDWKRWTLTFMSQAYSRRYALSSNAVTPGSDLAGYSLSNITLERPVTISKIQLRPRVAINNLFDRRYRTVLSRPMPGINFEAFLGVEF